MSDPVPNPLVRKLVGDAAASTSDRIVLDAWVRSSAGFPARELLIRAGDRNSAIYIVLSGWACRFVEVAGRARQITGFLLPGDHVASDRCFDFEFTHGVCTLGPCEIAEVPRHAVDLAERENPNIATQMRRASLVAEATLQEWLAGLGRRSAEQRMAHLFCELFHRLDAVGLAEMSGCRLPLTQATLSDALGLSSAHVNRTLQALRTRKLVHFENGVLQVPSLARLQKLAGFDARYLRLDRSPGAA